MRWKRWQQYIDIDILKRHVKEFKTRSEGRGNRPGRTGKPCKSDGTDDGAQMKTGHGVSQDYDGGIAVEPVCRRRRNIGCDRFILSAKKKADSE